LAYEQEDEKSDNEWLEAGDFQQVCMSPHFPCGHNVAFHGLTRTVKLGRKKPEDIALNGLTWPDEVDFIYNGSVWPSRLKDPSFVISCTGQSTRD